MHNYPSPIFSLKNFLTTLPHHLGNLLIPDFQQCYDVPGEFPAPKMQCLYRLDISLLTWIQNHSSSFLQRYSCQSCISNNLHTFHSALYSTCYCIALTEQKRLLRPPRALITQRYTDCSTPKTLRLQRKKRKKKTLRTCDIQPLEWRAGCPSSSMATGVTMSMSAKWGPGGIEALVLKNTSVFHEDICESSGKILPLPCKPHTTRTGACEQDCIPSLTEVTLVPVSAGQESLR